MRYYWLFVLVAEPLTSLATSLASLWDHKRVKHTWDVVPENWESLGPPLAGTTIDLCIALKPHRKNALIDALYEVSTPNRSRHYSREPLLLCRYGAHLSQDQVAELVAPHPDTLELVNSWLEYHSVPSSSISTTHGGSWLTVTGVPVSQANGLLGASYQLFRHAETNDTILRTIGYALPVVLQAHVQTVAPTTYFGSPQKAPHMRPDGAAALGEESVTVLSSRDNYKVTPSFLRSLYKSENFYPKATDRNKLGIAGYSGQYPSPTDLKLFTEYFLTDATNPTYTVEQVNGGGYDPRNPGTEGNINVQYTLGMVYPTPLIYYSTGGEPPFTPDSSTPINTNEPYLEWLNHVLKLQDIPQTISTSYGENEQSVPLDYAKSVCDLFAQLGARGVSILFASGNSGVGRGDCVVNDGSGRVQFLPIFPASCPFVTSVGGTQGFEPEEAADLSSGGFSNYFQAEEYQQEAVSIFLQNLGSKYHGLYNASMSRGFPDIAAQANRFRICFNGRRGLIGGTSCATPVVAGIISLLNGFLISRGKAPLGFLNPWLYSDARAGLNDITSGSNPGCGTDGFSAGVGWDPVTGLGTPNFEKLQKIIDKD
ncbi:subtilisin-like protein [Lactarius psammicola]|nr:subtilisin-like protein [Lactarius psammicola]